MISPLGTHAFRALTSQTTVSVDRARCVRHRCRQNECRKCIEVCPSGAPSWGEQGLNISSTSCRQCLRCLSVCPTAAIHAPEFSLSQILADLSAHPEPVLGCKYVPDSVAHGRFPCLGFMAHPELMLLFALIFVEGLQFNMTCCQDCPNGHILQGVYDSHAGLTQFTGDHKLTLVRNPQDLDYRPASISRRELFSFFREQSTRTASIVVERLQNDVGTQSYGSKKLPSVRAMLIQILKTLPDEQQEKIGAQIFGQISFTATCTVCGGCSGVCPTGAIQPAEEGMLAPRFQQEKCVSCGSCQAFCSKQGVMLLMPTGQTRKDLSLKPA